MADLILARAQSGAKIEINANAETNIVFGFDINEAIMSREEGSNALTFSFDDGSTTIITNFYDTYTSENMPDFIIEDQVIDGESFFASFDENLMPAAGPAASSESSGSSATFGDDDLVDGNIALGDVDIQTYARTNQEQDVNLFTDSNSYSFLSDDSIDNDIVAPEIDKPEIDEPEIDEPEIDKPEIDGTPPSIITIAVDFNNSETYEPVVIDINLADKASDFKEMVGEDHWTETNTGVHGTLGEQSISFGGDGTITKNPTDVSFTMSSVKVTVNANGNINNKDTDVENFGELGYRENNIKGHGNKGITVISGNKDDIIETSGKDANMLMDQVDWDNEIATSNQATEAGNFVSEGIKFELPEGNTVHGMTLDLSSFYPPAWKEGQETATIYFYKDGVLVEKVEIVADSLDGKFTYDAYVKEGFDEVIVKPNNIADFAYGSSFLIESISFSESIFPSYGGEIDYSVGTGDGVGGIAFSLEDKSTLTTDQGNLTISVVTNSDGSSSMTGIDAYGNVAFTASLTPNEDGTADWKFDANQDVTINNGKDFELGFDVTGKNGDTIDLSTPIDATVKESGTAESATPIIISEDRDSLNGDDDANILFGIDSDDIILGGAGNDKLYGGAGDDEVIGGAGRDMLYGGEGNDIIKFDMDDIFVDGGAGYDVAIGGTMDGILTNLENGSIEGVELFLPNMDNVDDLNGIGISLDDATGKFTFSTDWKQGEETVINNGDTTTTYVEMTSGTGDSEIAALVDVAVFNLITTS